MAQQMPLPLTVSCFRKMQIGFIFLVPAYPGSPGQRAVKRVCVIVKFGTTKNKHSVELFSNSGHRKLCRRQMIVMTCHQLSLTDPNAYYDSLAAVFGRTELTVLATVDVRLMTAASFSH